MVSTWVARDSINIELVCAASQEASNHGWVVVQPYMVPLKVIRHLSNEAVEPGQVHLALIRFRIQWLQYWHAQLQMSRALPQGMPPLGSLVMLQTVATMSA